MTPRIQRAELPPHAGQPVVLKARVEPTHGFVRHRDGVIDLVVRHDDTHGSEQLLLEDLLVKYPKLKVYVMHAGGFFPIPIIENCWIPFLKPPCQHPCAYKVGETDDPSRQPLGQQSACS